MTSPIKCPCLSIAFRWKWCFAAFTIFCKPFIAGKPMILLPFLLHPKTRTSALLRPSARKFLNWILLLFRFDFSFNTLTCHQCLCPKTIHSGHRSDWDQRLVLDLKCRALYGTARRLHWVSARFVRQVPGTLHTERRACHRFFSFLPYCS